MRRVIKVKADVAAVLDRTAQRGEWRRALSRNRSGSALLTGFSDFGKFASKVGSFIGDLHIPIISPIASAGSVAPEAWGDEADVAKTAINGGDWKQAQKQSRSLQSPWMQQSTPENVSQIDYTQDIEPMQEAAKNILLVLVTLFPIVDPLGGSPFFLALTREYSPEARKALSWRIAVNSFFLLVATYFVGTYVLAFFGISLPVVQVGGGLIVIATGWTLLKQRDDEKQDVQKTVQPQDTIRRAFYPLTLPLTVGPASISAAITLGANAAHHHAYHPLTILAALIGLALIAISILLCYGFADRLARILGATGMTVITQLSSFFLVCIGVQIAWNGMKALLESLSLHIG